MNPSLDKSLYYLTGNGNLDEVAIEDIEKLTNEYPFFSVGQLLLAKKLKQTNDNRFAEQVQKAALYIPNPYWLYYQLRNLPPAELDIIAEGPQVEQPAWDAAPRQDTGLVPTTILPSVAENPTAATPGYVEQLLEAPAEGENVEPSDNNFLPPAEADSLTETVPITTVFTKDEIEAASELAHEQLATDDTPPPLDEPQPITTTFSLEEIEAASELAHEQLATDDTPPPLDEPQPITTAFSLDEIETASELAREHLTDDHANALLTDSETLAIGNQPSEITANEQVGFLSEFPPTVAITPALNTPSQAEEEMATVSRLPDETAQVFVEQVEREQQQAEAASPAPEADEHEVMFQNIKAMLDATTDEVKGGMPNSVVPIDPYHTIDYFASQGIKLDLEANPQDKLGKQVKKFTQWLKHMKKLGPEDALVNVENQQAEADVQQAADTSNTAREIVTEAMAQVLEKQGKTAKARELYTKLSFLNPHKSAYFAAKINNLK